MTMIIDGSAGVTFPNSTVQASAGQVLQVVNATYSTQTTNASTSVYANTGLTASITPKFSTSKILVLINHNGNVNIGNSSTGAIKFKLQKNGSDISFIDGMSSYNGNSANNSGGATTSIVYQDSPATTSSTTYSTQFAARNVGTAYIQYNDGAGLQSVSTITLMEIAA